MDNLSEKIDTQVDEIEIIEASGILKNKILPLFIKKLENLQFIPIDGYSLSKVFAFCFYHK